MSIALEIVGDRWTLLILRDVLFRGFATFGQFCGSAEGIATNILADRLKKLCAAGIISGERLPGDARSVHYRPTAKGLDLLPTIVEMILWADTHEETAAPAALMRRLKSDKSGFLAEVRARFEPG